MAILKQGKRFPYLQGTTTLFACQFHHQRIQSQVERDPARFCPLVNLKQFMINGLQHRKREPLRLAGYFLRYKLVKSER